MTDRFSLAQQIEEVERELTLRSRVYPGFVASGKMKQSLADYHMSRMRAVLQTLKRLAMEEAQSGTR